MCESKDCKIDLNQTELNTIEVKTEDMRKALVAIAREVLVFHDSNNVTNHCRISNEDILNKLIKSKYSLAFKRKVIRKLKKKINTACTVAQAAISAGENESISLNGDLHLARNEYADLYQKYRQTSQIIQTMGRDNKQLHGKLENLLNVIKLGYIELQKINNECLPETSVTQQLKQIIISCGQYYADLNNERERNLQLDQKNRFLNNKINILNNSLEAMSEDLKNLRHHNARLQRENESHKEKNNRLQSKHSVPIRSWSHKNYRINYLNTMKTKFDFIRKPPDLDVTVHLSIINKLLRDQDDLLRDLKSLSKEVISDQNCYIKSKPL